MHATRAHHPAVRLALSGGGARGMAHLGVLEVLDEYGYAIRSIAAASYGSVIGGYYACGYSAEAMGRMLRDFSATQILNAKNPWRCLYDAEKLRALLDKDLGGVLMEDLETPLSILALDVAEARAVFFEKGSLVAAIMASTALPGLFPPMRIDGRTYIDGGMLRGRLVERSRELGSGLVVMSDASVISSLERSSLARAFYRFLAARAAKERERARSPAGGTRIAGLFGSVIRAVEAERRASVPAPPVGADITIRPFSRESRTHSVRVNPLKYSLVEAAVRCGREAAVRELRVPAGGARGGMPVVRRAAVEP